MMARALVWDDAAHVAGERMAGSDTNIEAGLIVLVLASTLDCGVTDTHFHCRTTIDYAIVRLAKVYALGQLKNSSRPWDTLMNPWSVL